MLPAPMKAVPAFVLIALLCLGATPLSARVWTDTEGHTREADIISANDDTVTLRLTGGKSVTLSQELLSGVDTIYIKDWLKKNPGRRTKPAPAPAAVAPAAVTPASAPVSPGLKPVNPMGLQKSEPGVPVSFDGKWPDNVGVPEELNIEVVKEDDAAKVYIYRSTHFEFTSNVQLRARLVSGCAKVFEATHEFLRLLPLNNRATGARSKLFPVLLFENYDQYLQAGGPRGSAGVCMERGSVIKVLVPLKSLGVRKTGGDYTVDTRAKDYSVLAHEITHMLMERDVKDASWYIEGSAEYVANTEYTGGRFKVAANKSAIVANVTAYGKDGNGGSALGKDIKMPRLEEFMTLSYGNFLINSRLNYGVACLLTYYFYHLDGNGDAARIKEYVKALQSGESDETARAKLTDGRSWDQMEADFVKGMRGVGVKIEFR